MSVCNNVSLWHIQVQLLNYVPCSYSTLVCVCVHPSRTDMHPCVCIHMYMHFHMIYSRKLCMCMDIYMYPQKPLTYEGKNTNVRVAHCSPSACLCIVKRYLYLEWTIEKDGFDFPVVASGLAFLWVQSQPHSDALIGARSFVPNSVSLHPWTSRNLYSKTLSHCPRYTNPALMWCCEMSGGQCGETCWWTRGMTCRWNKVEAEIPLARHSCSLQ